MDVSRFAPSTTGPAHPGTLLAALLCWLDARSRGARLLLRLEDLDPDRSRPRWSTAMRRDLEWLGLDWDATLEQHRERGAHEEALDRLAAEGRLYPCGCSRRDVRAAGAPAPDGGFSYPGTCRERALPSGGWRAVSLPLRVRLGAERVALRDESGIDLSGEPGDPVVRRRDGAVAYHLGGVVGDGRAGVTRVVRGRDLAATTPTQVALQRLLGVPTPRYRHHLLLLERRGAKLAKLHGSVGTAELRRSYDAPALCGVLAWVAGLLAAPDPVTPRELLAGFDWGRVGTRDRVLDWTGRALELVPPDP